MIECMAISSVDKSRIETAMLIQPGGTCINSTPTASKLAWRTSMSRFCAFH